MREVTFAEGRPWSIGFLQDKSESCCFTIYIKSSSLRKSKPLNINSFSRHVFDILTFETTCFLTFFFLCFFFFIYPDLTRCEKEVKKSWTWLENNGRNKRSKNCLLSPCKAQTEPTKNLWPQIWKGNSFKQAHHGSSMRPEPVGHRTPSIAQTLVP